MRGTHIPGSGRRSSSGGGAEASGYALADKVYDLSRALGTLRTRSIANVEALRSVAQGVPELDQAFRPLLAALEAGLAECHQADLEAIFGRPEPLRDMLKSPPPPQIGRGFGRVRGGGTEAAAQHLADALSVFDRDVEAAGMLVEDGASLRTVVRWARRARKSARSLATAPALEGGAPSAKHAASDDDRAGGKSKPGTDNGEGAVAGGNARKDWTLRILRAPVSGLDGDCAIDRGSGHGNGAPNRASTSDSGSRDNSGSCPSRCRTKRGRNGENEPPLVVVNALRVPLPQVPAVPATASAEGARVMAPRPGLRAAGEAGSVPEIRRQWRNPFSWLAGYYWRRDGEVCRAPGPSLSTTPPAPLLAPPRIVVHVVYVGRATDVARFARSADGHGGVQEFTVAAAAAASASAAAAAAAAADTAVAQYADASASSSVGDGRASRPNDEEGDTIEGTPPWVGGTGKDNAAVVELVKSEVRIRRACFPAAAARENPERTRTNGADTEPRLVSRSATQLQIVLELRTRTPVVVSRVLHTGGGARPYPHLCPTSPATPSSSREVLRQSALSSPGPVSSLLRPSVLAVGRSAVGDPAGPGEPCRGRSGNDTGRSGGSGDGGDVGFGAGVGRRGNGVGVAAAAAAAGSERAAAGAGRRGAGGEYDQGGGGLNDGCRGQSCGIRDEDEADEIIPSGWVEAPAELSLPGDPTEHGPKLKVGTSHVLGMNVVLPELTSEASNPSPAQVSEPSPKTPLHCTSLNEGTRAPAPRRGESQPAEAQEDYPPTSRKRKGSFGGGGNDEPRVYADQVERQGAARPRANARKRSRVSNAGGARAPGSGVRGGGHDTGAMAGGDSSDSRGQGGALTARNASRSSRLRAGGSSGGVDGGGGGRDGGGGSGGGFSMGQGGTDGGMGEGGVRNERKTWWGWRLPSLWGRENGSEIRLPDSSPAPCRPIQEQRQQQQQQSAQSQEVHTPLSGMNGVQASVSTTDNRGRGVSCDTSNVSPQESEERNGAVGGGAPSSDFGVSRETGGSPLLKRSPLLITVVLAAPPAATPA